MLSRNLTFDRSWDTLVRLDGRLDADWIYEENEPLYAFIKELPGLAVQPLRSERLEAVEAFAEEVRSVEWELPEGFTGLRFLPSGIPQYSSQPLEHSDRLLVIAPFLTNQQLSKAVASSERATLISRSESLDQIHGDLLNKFEEVLILAEGALQSEGSDQERPVGVTEDTAERPGALGPGIHAKVLITEVGGEVEFRTGSKNATDAGWGGNVEFDIGLVGRRKLCGVEAVLGDNQSGTTLRALLERYSRADPEPVALADSERVAVILERYGRELARVPLRADVENDGDLFRIILRSDRPLPHTDDVEIKCWPVTRSPEVAVRQIPGQPVHLSEGALSLQALTSFFAFELSAPSTDGLVSIRLVTNARLVGAPADRAERLLAEQLRTRSDVLRYFLFLLMDLGDESAYDLESIFSMNLSKNDGERRDFQIPLFESMVRALSRNPEALAPIDRLINELSRTEEGRRLLPEGLEQLWPAIWEARSQVA
ncbi:MAG TPA: phospholipase D family protein [Acidimicrobiia bacterium]|nr:phospholipase D family protein [Acidimicrobiia bacterium]